MSKTEFNQELSSAKANADYLLKTEDDLITGILSLEQGGNLNSYISNLQGHLYTIADIIGIAGEADPSAKVYTSTEFIANGDSRKVAIEKLDAQVKINADSISNNLVLITDNTASIVAILDSVGAANGICPLDGSAKIPAIYLPDVLLEYKGTWDASNNTPTLADGTGELNDWYRVNMPGTVDFGSGPISFEVNDKVVHNGNIWEKWDTIESVISVNGQLGAVVLDKTDIGLSSVTDDAQLKRSGADWGLFTEKVSPVEDDIVLIEDSEDSFNKKTVKLLNLLGSGGGGGGSFVWSLSEDISPLESVQGGIEVLGFDSESQMAVSALLVVPEGYIPGRQIALESGLFFSAGSQDNVLFKATSTLFKVGDNITNPIHNHLSINTEITLSTPNIIEGMGVLDVTDSTGNINGQAVGPGDIIKIKLYRDNNNETVSSLEDAKFLKYSTNINLDYEAPPIVVLPSFTRTFNNTTIEAWETLSTDGASTSTITMIPPLEFVLVPDFTPSFVSYEITSLAPSGFTLLENTNYNIEIDFILGNSYNHFFEIVLGGNVITSNLSDFDIIVGPTFVVTNINTLTFGLGADTFRFTINGDFTAQPFELGEINISEIRIIQQ